jgi:hypothetical protein
MFLKRASQPFFWGLFAATTLTLPAIAQPDANNTLPLSRPSIPEAVDKVNASDQHWNETGIADDARWLFGIDYGEKRIERRARRFEALYVDLLKQQSESHAIMRTQDLPSQFNTSLLEMYPQSSSAYGPKVEEVSQAVAPMSPSMPTNSMPVEPPTSVPGLW